MDLSSKDAADFIDDGRPDGVADMPIDDSVETASDFVPTGESWEPADIDMGTAGARVQRLHLSEPEGEGDVPKPKTPPIGKDEFRQLFIGSFGAPKVMLGPEWEPFDVQPHEQGQAITTADLIYDWLAKMGWLPKQGQLGLEAGIALMFVMGKLKIASTIFARQKADKIAAQNSNQQSADATGEGNLTGFAWMPTEGGVQ